MLRYMGLVGVEPTTSRLSGRPDAAVSRQLRRLFIVALPRLAGATGDTTRPVLAHMVDANGHSADVVGGVQ